MSKKTILVDLDGVLNEYNGKYDGDFIPKIREGAKDFLELLSQTYEIKIFTTRQKDQVKKWLKINELNKIVKDTTDTKEPAFLIIDDRCISFNGDYRQTMKKIKDFKVWYK